MLIYQTDDSDFAESVVDELKRADIGSYTTGGLLPGGSSPTVSVFIHNAGDYQRANEILLRQGAAVDVPLRISPKWIAVGLLVVITLMALVYVVLLK